MHEEEVTVACIEKGTELVWSCDESMRRTMVAEAHIQVDTPRKRQRGVDRAKIVVDGRHKSMEARG